MKKVLQCISLFLILLLLLGGAALLYSRPWQNALFVRPLHAIPGDEKVVALTFDDGPGKERTPGLLGLLNHHGIQATFFMLGKNIEQHPEIARAVYEEGHLIGNHSYDHPRLMFRSPSFVRDQILKTDGLIKSLGQREVRFFRPPYTSKFVVLPWVLRSMDKVLVTGSYDPPSEYHSPYNAQNVAREVIEHTRPGSIIYLHDGKDSDAQEFVESVELIILGLRERGYRFVRLDYRE